MASTSECRHHPGTHFEWIEVSPSKKVHRCPICYGKVKDEKPQKGFLVKYSPTYWRERPLTDKEKRNPPRRGT